MHFDPAIPLMETCPPDGFTHQHAPHSQTSYSDFAPQAIPVAFEKFTGSFHIIHSGVFFLIPLTNNFA